MSTGQSDLHHLCVVSSVFLIKFKKNLVLTFKQFRSNTKLHYLRFMRDKQGIKKKKLVYNDLGAEKCGHLKEGLIKVRYRLVVNESNQPLLAGGHYSEVVVKSGLTVQTKI